MTLISPLSIAFLCLYVLKSHIKFSAFSVVLCLWSVPNARMWFSLCTYTSSLAFSWAQSHIILYRTIFSSFPPHICFKPCKCFSSHVVSSWSNLQKRWCKPPWRATLLNKSAKVVFFFWSFNDERMSLKIAHDWVGWRDIFFYRVEEPEHGVFCVMFIPTGCFRERQRCVHIQTLSVKRQVIVSDNLNHLSLCIAR